MKITSRILFFFLLGFVSLLWINQEVSAREYGLVIENATYDQVWDACLRALSELGERIEREDYYVRKLVTRPRIYRESYQMKDWRHQFFITIIRLSESRMKIIVERNVQKAIRIYPRSEEDWYPAEPDGDYEQKLLRLIRKQAVSKTRKHQQVDPELQKIPPTGETAPVKQETVQDEIPEKDETYTDPAAGRRENQGTISEAPLEYEDTGESLFEMAVSGELSDSTEGDTERSTREATRGQLELNGYIRANLFGGTNPETEDNEIKTSYGEIALQMRARKLNVGDAFGEIRFSSSRSGDESEDDVTIREAYVNVYPGPMDIRLGYQIIAWGRADGLNPTDNVTPRDLRFFSPEVDDRRLANFALRTHYNALPLRIELIWVPQFKASFYPDFTLPDYLVLGETDLPGEELSAGTGAVRIHLITSAIDLSLSWLSGYSSFPSIRFNGLTQSEAGLPQVEIGLTSYKQQVFGFDFATTIGNLFGFRGELAYRQPEERLDEEYLPLEDIHYVIGLDREFGNFSIIAQYFGLTVMDWTEIEPADLAGFFDNSAPKGRMRSSLSDDPEDLIINEITLQNRMLWGQQEETAHGGSLRFEWKFLQETLFIETLGLYNVTTEELLLRPLITYAITDDLTTRLGAELYSGPEGTLFGNVEELMSTVFIELKASF